MESASVLKCIHAAIQRQERTVQDIDVIKMHTHSDHEAEFRDKEPTAYLRSKRMKRQKRWTRPNHDLCWHGPDGRNFAPIRPYVSCSTCIIP